MDVLDWIRLRKINLFSTAHLFTIHSNKSYGNIENILEDDMAKMLVELSRSAISLLRNFFALVLGYHLQDRKVSHVIKN